MQKIIWIFLLVFGVSWAQDSTRIQKSIDFQKKLNLKFASKDSSPLTKQDFELFKKLDYFKIDTTFCVKAQFIRTPYETPFVMQTTTDREPIYVKYGEVRFELDGNAYTLNVYQSQGLNTEEEYVDYLFLPFTDLTNGITTYEGGRFLDLKIPDRKEIWIDFNQAYNPYCAYNAMYSCPIPPKENHLPVAISAGVKKYKKSKKISDF